ncbi:MAG: Wzz/FepE/Etk N-terminal domain-containing protein [Candidatus Humimicrobiaceae bacterium]
MAENYKTDEYSADLRDVFRILIKRKIAFFISFAIILIIALTYTFLLGPNYLSTSKLKINNLDTAYNNILNKFFPEESGSLLIFPTDRIGELEVSKLNLLLNQIKYGDILDNVSEISGKKYLKKDLIKSMDLRINTDEKVLTINIYSKNAQDAYGINKAIIDYYLNKKDLEFNKSYSDLLVKIDTLVINKNKTLDDLLNQAEKYVTDYNLSFIEKLKKSDLVNLNFIGINYIPPTLTMSINNIFGEVNDLTGAKNILEQNKDLFVKRITIAEYPEFADVVDYSNFVRNIVLSIIVSLIFAAIISFIANYFKTPKQH